MKLRARIINLNRSCRSDSFERVECVLYVPVCMFVCVCVNVYMLLEIRYLNHRWLNDISIVKFQIRVSNMSIS